MPFLNISLLSGIAYIPLRRSTKFQKEMTRSVAKCHIDNCSIKQSKYSLFAMLQLQGQRGYIGLGLGRLMGKKNLCFFLSNSLGPIYYMIKPKARQG